MNIIEGIKITINGTELQELCQNQATHHFERATVYAEQLLAMKANEIEGMEYSGGDPTKAISDRRDKHKAEAQELKFIADHINPAATYILDTRDLAKLGIVTNSRYY